MPPRLFARTATPLEMEGALEAGQRNWNTGRSNPYMVEGEPVSPLLWWAYECGVRLGAYLDAEKRGLFDKRKAEREVIRFGTPSRWPFARGANA